MSLIVFPHWLKHNEQQAHVHRLLHNTSANHIAPIYMYILGQTHKCTTLHYGKNKKSDVQTLWAHLELFHLRHQTANGALMNVFEECQFILWACNGIVEYDISSVTNLIEVGVSQGTEAAYSFDWLTKQA